MKPPNVILMLLVVIAALAVSPASAQATHFIAPAPTGDDATGDGSRGNPYATIQFVYDNVAASGDTLSLLPGIHDGCIIAVEPGGRSVNIVSDSGDPTDTIIENDPTCPAFPPRPVIVIGEGSSLDGVTIRSGVASGVIARGSSTVTNNIIEGNSSSAGAGVFVYTANCYYGDTLTTVSNNIIRNNSAEFQDGDPESGSGGGIYVTAQALTLECGNLPEVGSPTVVIEGNTIESNSAEIAGGGVYAFTNTTSTSFPSEVQITNNLIDGNSAGIPSAPGAGGTGGGVFTTTFGYYTETITIDDNDIRLNTSTGSGGGLTAQIDSFSFAHHTVNVTDNVVTGNTAEEDGGGLNLFLYAQDLEATQSVAFTASHNTATGNMCSGVSAGGGGLLAIFQSIRSSAPNMSFAVEGNRLTDNVAEFAGAGASLLASAEADDASLPSPDGLLAPATATIDFENNLVARNDSLYTGPDPDSGGVGGGILAFLLAFGEATATTNLNLNTINENTNELGSGGIEIEVFTGWDNVCDENLDFVPDPGCPVGSEEGIGVVEVDSSSVADNTGFGIGGPFPGGGTANIDVNIIQFSDFFNNSDVIVGGGAITNFEAWVNDRTGFFGNISEDPMLTAFPAYKPLECSPTLDTGNDAFDASLEPAPNGGRVNMGHLGGTGLLPGANAAASDVTSLTDPSGDGRVDGVDVLRISTSWGATATDNRYLVEADLDGVCSVGGVPCVDGDDLALVSPNYGKSCN